MTRRSILLAGADSCSQNHHVRPRRRRYWLERLEERAMLAYNLSLSFIPPIDEGETAVLDGSVSGLQPGATYRLDIDWADGSTVEQVTGTVDGTGSQDFSVTHPYVEDGDYSVVVDLSELILPENDFVHAVQAGTDAQVDNQTPTVSNLTLSASLPILEGGFVTLSGDVFDPGIEDTFTLTVDWGDGSIVVYNYPAGTTEFEATYQYEDDIPTATSSDVNTIVPSFADDDSGVAALAAGGGGQPNYFPSGPQTNVSENDLTGWEPCWSSLYGFSFDDGNIYMPNGDDPFAPTEGDPMSDVFGANRCSGEYLLVAAGAFPGDAPYVFDVLAVSAREDVLMDTGTGNGTHNANGVGWYFDENSAMGFATEGNALFRSGGGCDVSMINAATRLCWNTKDDQIIGGFRNGAVLGLNSDNGDSFNYGRFIYQEHHDAGLSVTVENVVPVLNNLAITSPLDEDGLATLTGEILDPGAGDTFTLEISWGDGDVETLNLPAGTTAINATHRYRDDHPTSTAADTYAVDVLLTDDDLASTSGNTAVVVRNLAPTVTDLNASAVPCSNVVSLAGAFSDDGLLDTHTVVVDWGDGTSGPVSVNETNGTGTFSSSHAYATGGAFTVTVTLADDDSGQHVATTTALVSGAAVNSSGTLQVIGTNAAESVVVRKVNQGTQIRVIMNDTDVSQFAAGGVQAIEIRACGGSDTVRIGANLGDSGSESEGDVSNAVLIDGGAGDDHLIGGPGDDIIFGGPGNDMLRGRDGDDALLGGDNDDQLFGGNGEDLLVGGNGSDDLRGNNDGDLLIGGFTSFDSNKAAVSLIMQEWTSGQSYMTRVDNLRNGTGAILAGSGVTLLAAGPLRTVFDDSARDRMRGQDGRDCFFADLNGAAADNDVLNDDQWNELIDQIFE